MWFFGGSKGKRRKSASSGGNDAQQKHGSVSKNEKLLHKRIAVLEAENRRLREALQFYADPSHWKEGHKYRDDDDATIFEDMETSSVSADMGAVALRALKE